MSDACGVRTSSGGRCRRRTGGGPCNQHATAGRRLRHWVLQQRELTGPALTVLDAACGTLDVIEDLEATVAAEGTTAVGSTDQVVVHPAVRELRQQRLALARLLGQLPGLEDAQAQVLSPASARGQRAAQARWERDEVAQARAARAAGSTRRLRAIDPGG